MALFAVEPGTAHPVGIAVSSAGANFSLFSQAATEVALLLFDSATAIEPSQTIRLDPFRHKTFHFWSVFVCGCGPGTFYTYHVDGPVAPAEGHRFNPNKSRSARTHAASARSCGNAPAPWARRTI